MVHWSDGLRQQPLVQFKMTGEIRTTLNIQELQGIPLRNTRSAQNGPSLMIVC